MPKPKKEEAEKGPTLSGVIFLGACSAAFGVLFGFLFLSSLPVKSLASAKDLIGIETERATRDVRPDDVYYFEAPVTRGRLWSTRRDALLSGQGTEVEISLGDLNGWTTTFFRPAPPPVGDDKPTLVLSAKEPKFGTDGKGTLFLSLPLTVEAMDISRRYLLHTRGHFDGSNEFKVDRFYVNNAPIPNFLGISGMVFNSFLKLFEDTDEYQLISNTWPQVKSVEVTVDALQLKL
jgi:hypothetical protein